MENKRKKTARRVSKGSRGTRKKGGLSKSTMIVLFILGVVCYYAYTHYKQKYQVVAEESSEEVVVLTETKSVEESSETETSVKSATSVTEDVSVVYKITQPLAVEDNQIVSHKAYTLSYNNKYEQADWVYYLLTRDMINGEVERTDDFREDETIELGSAVKADYTRSGYDRGHLCPSADVRHDLEAQSETFYMSNMSPQAPGFNRGVWKELEEQTREYTLTHDSVYIVTGPVLMEGLKTIGRVNNVAVPEYYYKILYSPKDGGKMLGYLMKNDKLLGEPNDYIVPVDEIEKMSGLDFFPEIKAEESLEGKKGDLSWWAQ